jgi:hypothetical protein
MHDKIRKKYKPHSRIIRNRRRYLKILNIWDDRALFSGTIGQLPDPPICPILPFARSSQNLSFTLLSPQLEPQKSNIIIIKNNDKSRVSAPDFEKNYYNIN